MKRQLITALVALMVLLTALFGGCGSNDTLIVGHWEMTQVLVGDRVYPADEFLDPTAQNDSSFVLQIYGDGTLVATGSLGTDKGSSEGVWEQTAAETYTVEIDDIPRDVKLVGDMLFMEIQSEKIPMTILFEKIKR